MALSITVLEWQASLRSLLSFRRHRLKRLHRRRTYRDAHEMRFVRRNSENFLPLPSGFVREAYPLDEFGFFAGGG